MRKIHYLSVYALLLSTGAWSMSFKSNIQPLKLPLILSTEQPPSIKYTAPGKVNVTALRMCGDGDVAHFQSEHPDFDFVSHDLKKLDVVMGYWIVEDSSSDILPSSSNFYPVVYQKIDIAEKTADLNPEGKFFPITQDPISATSNGLDIMKSEMINLYGAAKQAYKADKVYRVMAGTFACVDPDESSELTVDGGGSFTPSPVQTMHSLSQIPEIVNDAFNTMNLDKIVDDNKKISIETKAPNQRKLYQNGATPEPYKYTLGDSGVSLNTQLLDLGEKILKADLPAGDLAAYKTAMEALPFSSALSGISGNDFSYCNSVGASANKDVKRFNFELFPMNLSCKHLYGGGALVSAYNALFNPGSKPDEGQFKNLKKDLAKRFYTAAALEAAQKDHSDNGKVVHSGCFKKTNQKLIGRLVGSYPLKFVVDGGKYALKPNTNNHIHPESLFAISDYTNYFAHEVLAIWGQVTPGQGSTDATTIKNSNGIKLPLNNNTELLSKPVDTSSFGSPININFKVRSVGGSCTIYC